MFKRKMILVTFSAFIVIFSSALLAASDQAAMSSMANIMMKLNHYPSDSEKQQLNKFISDTSLSSNVKTMAQAMVNLQHQATSEDKKKLSKIMNDKSASADERTLASVIHNLDHMPSSTDKQELGKIAK